MQFLKVIQPQRFSIALVGSPNVSGLASPFNDVSDDSWYSDALKWAASAGIVSGYGDGKSGAEDYVTRQDLAVMLNNYTRFAGMNLPITRDYQTFNDDIDIANYAKEAIEQFFRANIISGYPDGSFNPKGEATRAEFAAMLQRFIEAVK